MFLSMKSNLTMDTTINNVNFKFFNYTAYCHLKLLLMYNTKCEPALRKFEFIT